MDRLIERENCLHFSSIMSSAGDTYPHRPPAAPSLPTANLAPRASKTPYTCQRTRSLMFNTLDRQAELSGDAETPEERREKSNVPNNRHTPPRLSVRHMFVIYVWYMTCLAASLHLLKRLVKLYSYLKASIGFSRAARLAG